MPGQGVPLTRKWSVKVDAEGETRGWGSADFPLTALDG